MQHARENLKKSELLGKEAHPVEIHVYIFFIQINFGKTFNPT